MASRSNDFRPGPRIGRGVFTAHGRPDGTVDLTYRISEELLAQVAAVDPKVTADNAIMSLLTYDEANGRRSTSKLSVSVQPLFLVQTFQRKRGTMRQMPASPSATAISVVEVLAKLDGEFAAVASAVENGEFALWVGSGISRNAPNLPDLIARGMEALRIRAMDPATREQFEPALLTAIREARADPDAARLYFEHPFAEWPMAKAITNELWTHYSSLLDIRVEHQAADWMLWDGIDIRAAFAQARSTPRG